MICELELKWRRGERQQCSNSGLFLSTEPGSPLLSRGTTFGRRNKRFSSVELILGWKKKMFKRLADQVACYSLARRTEGKSLIRPQILSTFLLIGMIAGLCSQRGNDDDDFALIENHWHRMKKEKKTKEMSNTNLSLRMKLELNKRGEKRWGQRRFPCLFQMNFYLFRANSCPVGLSWGRSSLQRESKRRERT